MSNARHIASGSIVAVLGLLYAQQPTMTNQQEQQQMLDQLHLTALRGGVSGSAKGPNPVNYDEAKGGPVGPLPEPLRLANGKRVTSAKQWSTVRRPQLLSLFDEYEYGRVPASVPPVTWKVVSVERETVKFDDATGVHHEIPVVTKDLIGQVDNSADPAIAVNIGLHLTTPSESHAAVPVIMELAFDPPVLKPGQKAAGPPAEPTWQEQILLHGWGYAVLYATSIQPDNGAGLRQGIIGLVDHGGLRKPDEWGALRAWAWGSSRALDYFETDASVNAKAVGIMGHSRFGKAALVTMVYDQRFAIGYISSSGAGGVNLWRRSFGEQLENIASSGEYHWMDGNFLRYAADPLSAKDLPLDQHELIALCAPRPVFIGAGSVKGDGWADPEGMFLAEVAASPVYRLLGAHGLPVSDFPMPGTALISGDLAYREHLEGHTPEPNWSTFLEFASRYLHTKP